MVKTHVGRKPGKKHAKIVKQLRHRRRQLQAASVACQRMEPASEVVESCLYECLERQPELPFIQLCDFLPSWMMSTCSENPDVIVDGSEMQLVASKESEEPQDFELVSFKGVKTLTRGASDTGVVGCGVASSKFLNFVTGLLPLPF